MKKRIFTILLTACIAALAAFPAAAAETAENQGSCGDGLTWTYENGTLTISGEGEMDDYGLGAPWAAYSGEIETLVLDGVTYIGACAFRDYDALKTVDFGDDLYQIGQYAFESCDGLTSIALPDTFKIFDEGCFQSCGNLTEIHCAGKFPTFRHNSMWETAATIYYPAEQPWSLELVEQLESAFKGRIEFRASDGNDPYVYQGPTEATEATEPETEPETQAPTEPPIVTEPETQPPVTETEPEITEAPTIPQTEPAEETQAPTVPAEPEEPADVSGILIGLLIVIIVMTLVIIGALIFKAKSRNGRFSA